MTAPLKVARALLFAAVAPFAAGCRAPSTGVRSNPGVHIAQAPGFPRTIQDASGRELTIKSPPRRIISLAPSNTEIAYALDLSDNLVADTVSCDYPPAARGKRHVSDLQGGIEDIVALSPDLVLAASGMTGAKVQALQRLQTPVLVVPTKTLADVYDEITLIGRATGHDVQAERLNATLHSRMEAVKAAVAGASRTRVLILYSASPLFTTGPGWFIDDVIGIAGGRNIIDRPPPRNTISPEQVVALQPEVIICDPADVPAIKRIPGWIDGVPAVRNGKFYCLPDQRLLVRPGPRLAQAAESLARYLHPERFPPPEFQGASGARL